MGKKITRPTKDDELLLDDVAEDSVDCVMLRGRRIALRWIKPGTQRKFTSLMIHDGDDTKTSCKAAALFILNGYWKIKFLYQFLWRWMYYVRQYGEEELTELIALAKKKIPVQAYLINTTLLTGMKDTMMKMTKKEVESILPELSGGNGEKSARSVNGSQNP